MANQQINRLLRRRPEIDEAEFELLQSRVLARLSKVDPEAPEGPADADPDAEPTESTESADAHLGPGQVTTYELPEVVVGVMATPGDAASDDAAAANAYLADEQTATADPSLGRIDLEEPKVDRPVDTVAPASPPDTPPVSIAEAPAPIDSPGVPARAKRKPRAAVPVRTSSTPTQPVVSPYCPYCARLLEPAPEVTRRCPRCRERIVVKRVDGRAVYLTEASVLVFDAERKRMAIAGRWTRERARWLKVAAVAGAPADRMARLQAAPLSEAVVAAVRSLYASTVDRSFRAAKRERRWEDASRIMREHAHVLSRMAGSPIPPPEESIEAHRQGAAAALHGVGEMAREAELVSARCCEICQADDGRTFRIAQELRVPRLPHAGCPKGLCRCDWYLAVRDQSVVRRHLRRRARADTSATNRSA